MTQAEYHTHLETIAEGLKELHTQELAFQAAFEAALEKQLADLTAFFDARTAELLAVAS